MRGVNKVILVGTLGRDPETKSFPNGGSITSFSIATSESWNDKNSGERQESTEWHRIATNNRLAEVAAQYLKKGSKVYIEGSLRTRKWTDKDGVERYTTEIRAESMQMLDGAPKQGGDNAYPEYQNSQGGGNQNSYGGNQNSYGGNQNSYGGNQNGYGGNQGGYQNNQNGNQGRNNSGQQQTNQPAANQQAPQSRAPQNQQPAGNYNQNPASGANDLDDNLPF